MNQKGEYILVAVTVILIAAAGIVFFDTSLRSRVIRQSAEPSATNSQQLENDIVATTQSQGPVKVTIDFGDGTVVESTRDTTEPLDAREVVYLAAVSNKFSVRAGEKFLPIAIGETANEEQGKSWTLYINGRSVDSLELVSVKSGDVLTLKYE